VVLTQFDEVNAALGSARYDESSEKPTGGTGCVTKEIKGLELGVEKSDQQVEDSPQLLFHFGVKLHRCFRTSETPEGTWIRGG
jgi:hypothetical protein